MANWMSSGPFPNCCELPASRDTTPWPDRSPPVRAGVAPEEGLPCGLNVAGSWSMVVDGEAMYPVAGIAGAVSREGCDGRLAADEGSRLRRCCTNSRRLSSLSGYSLTKVLWVLLALSDESR